MQRLNKISPRVVLKLLILLFCILFVPYIILCFYAHPVADDFAFTPLSPFWESQQKLYLQWNGRYSANFMAMVNPMLFHSLAGYRSVGLVLLLLVPLSVFFVLSCMAGRKLALLQKIFIAIIIAICILCLMPSLAEGIYWYSGSVTYTLGCIMAMFYIGTVVMYLKKDFIINRLVHICLCVMFLFLAIGFNEVQMFLLLFGHVLLCLSIKKEERFRSFPFLMLLFCALFSSFVFFSPGNHFRGSCYPLAHRFLYALFMSLLQILRYFFYWISYGPLLLGSILFAPVSKKLNKRSDLFQRLGEYKPSVLFSLLWVILFLCIFPPYWSTGILGQHRTLNTACFFFVPSWFLFLHSIYSRNGIAEKTTQLLKRPLQISLTLILAAALLFSGNCGAALMELVTGKVTGFDKEMNNREAVLMAAKKQGLKEVLLPTLQYKPGTLFVLDIHPGHNYWVNKEYARFFELEKVYSGSLKDTNGR